MASGERKGQFFLRLWPLVGWPRAAMDGWPYIHEYMGSTNWTRGITFLKKAKSTKSEWGRGGSQRNGAEYAQNTMHEILRRLLQLLHVS